MRRTLLLTLAAVLVGSVLSAQERPDLSGMWRLDPSRSESAMQGEPIGPVTLQITQSPTEITIETISTSGTSKQTYQLDGSDAPLAPGNGRARWVGDQLSMNALREVRGMSVTMQQLYRVTGDGSEMHVDSVLEVQHGYTLAKTKNYGAGKDVYLRVR